MNSRISRIVAVAVLLVAGGGLAPGGRAAPQPNGPLCFPETGQCIDGPFLAYWQANGGLVQQGLPLTPVFSEVNPADGQRYPVQYFERARFEYHAEGAGGPFEVLLGQLGREQFAAKYPTGAPSLGTGGGRCFPKTGECVRGEFHDYWQRNGGLRQQGLPISPEFPEVSAVDGRTYRVQYFERARFELHPENEAPFDVLLGLLGREQLLARAPIPPFPAPGDGTGLRFDPPRVSFGTQRMVSLVSKDVTVTNQGPVARTVADVRITGERFPDRESASQFFVRPGSCAGYSFPPGGGACVLTVFFAPTVPGDFEATLELALSSGEAQGIPLTGTARAER